MLLIIIFNMILLFMWFKRELGTEAKSGSECWRYIHQMMLQLGGGIAS